MSDKQIFKLVHHEARRRAMAAVANAPEGSVVRVGPSTRTLDQSAKAHAIFGDVSKQAKWHGRSLLAEQWKVLFISGHAIATGIGADMLPGLENEYVNLRESTAQMSVKRMSSLIEYCVAWCVEHEVVLQDTYVENV